jgi:Leucine-rich repeat (LRR) protein
MFINKFVKTRNLKSGDLKADIFQNIIHFFKEDFIDCIEENKDILNDIEKIINYIIYSHNYSDLTIDIEIYHLRNIFKILLSSQRYSIKCTKIKHKNHINLNVNAYIHRLHISSHSRELEFPKCILETSHHLVELSLNGEMFQGVIPDEICHLINVKRLYITNTLFTQFPKDLSSLTNLYFVFLQNNKFYSPIPQTLCDLAQLKELTLENCKFISPLPDFSKLQRLTVLNISGNSFDSKIDQSNIFQLGKLKELNLWNCNLSGSLKNITILKSLEILNILEGNIFSDIKYISYLYETLKSVDLSFYQSFDLENDYEDEEYCKSNITNVLQWIKDKY